MNPRSDRSSVQHGVVSGRTLNDWNHKEFRVNGSKRKNYDLSLSLTIDQYDDLTTALEDRRDGLRKMAGEAVNGFGLGAGYWNGRAEEVQDLLNCVRSYDHRGNGGSNRGIHPKPTP